MPGREGSRCLTRQEQVSSYSRAPVMTAATATTLRAAVLLRRMSLSRLRVFPGMCTKAHEGVFQGAPRGGAHTSPPLHQLKELGLDSQRRAHKTVLKLHAHSVHYAFKVSVWSRGLPATLQIPTSFLFSFGWGDSRHFGPMCLVFLN